MGTTAHPCRVILRATGSYVPAREVSSETLGRGLGLSAVEIVRRTGIASRRWAEAGESTASMAVRAGQRALSAAGLSGAEIDQVLVSSTSPDMPFPATACFVQDALNIRGPAMDLMASCSGFLAGLSMARSMILAGFARRILVVASDVKSRFLDMEDPATAVLFGDGAGAAILEGVPADGAGLVIGPVTLHTDGRAWDLVHMPAGGSRRPTSHETVEAGLHTLKMRGIPLFKMAVTRFSGVVRECLAADGWGVRDVDCFVFHQANLRILEAVAGRLGILPGQLATTVERLGNTSSASLPITLDEALGEGRIGPGGRVVLATFGGGVTWGACSLSGCGAALPETLSAASRGVLASGG